MDIPVVISHRTAWLLYHAPRRQEVLASSEDFGINEIGLSARTIGERIQRLLQACGVPERELETLDILFSMDFMRMSPEPFRAHAFGALVTADDVHELVPGLCVVREELCFMQAATWMSRLELIEFGYELCGRYEMLLSQKPDESQSYIECLPRTTRDELAAYVTVHAGLRGAKRAKSALVRIRDCSRSPMETATAMLIVLSRREGGLGYRGVQMNHRLDVPERVRAFTTSSHLEVDIYDPRSKTGIEYDGEDHAAALQRARDAERLTVLGAMGVRVHVITRHQFAEQLRLHRAMNAVARSLGVKLDASLEFQRRQNELRKFLIRAWPSQAC